MNSREKVNKIFNRSNEDVRAYWVGNPDWKTIPIYAKEWGVEPTTEALSRYLNDDCRFVMADDGYKLPTDREVISPLYSLDGIKPILAEVEDVSELEKFNWPSADDCDFSEIYKKIDGFGDKMVFTGVWSPFFHMVADLFGMEEYFIKMYENPAVVEAVTEKIVDYYIAANDKFFAGVGGRADVMFFGNDFGTQADMFVSPENFRKFILPSFKRLVNVGKKHGKKILLHSCGSIHRIIPDLIDAGVDALHPLQAQAKGMSADELSQYKNDLAFVGGIDAQSFFVNATPQEIEDEVKRVRDILGPNIVISPSHEAILENVPARNVVAMSKAALS